MKLDRLGDITSELSSSLVKSIVLPGGLLDWLSKPLAERLREKLRTNYRSNDVAETTRTAAATGPLILMGGAPVPDEAIVAMIHLAGGRSAKVAVIPVAATDPEQAGSEGLRLFTRFGMRNAQIVNIHSPAQANDPTVVGDLKAYDAVLLTGENARQGLGVLRGTACSVVLQELMASGKPIAGLGGGAEMLAERVVLAEEGQESLTAGLSLAPGLVLETQFTQLSRFGRLARTLHQEAGTPLFGAGIDSGAALAIRGGEAKVLGEGSVTFLDAREAMPVADVAATAPGSVGGIKVHVLMDGYSMSLKSRRPLGQMKEPAQAVGER